MRRIIFPISLLIFCFIPCIIVTTPCKVSAEENRKYIGKGESIIVNNDIPSAKKKALLDAFKDAIQKAVGVYVKAQTKVENFEMTYSKIMGESEGYITNYKIKKEKTKDNIYNVEIEAEVPSDKIVTAFNQRLSKYITANIIGPNGYINLKIISGWGVDKSYNLIFSCPINDPTIDINKLFVKLPKTGWLKPEISTYGITKTIQISTKYDNINMYVNANLEYLKDLMLVLEKNKEFQIKFINPNNSKQEIKNIKFDVVTIHISDRYLDNNEGRTYVKIEQQKLSDIEKSELKKMLDYLNNINYWLTTSPPLSSDFDTIQDRKTETYKMLHER